MPMLYHTSTGILIQHMLRLVTCLAGLLLVSRFVWSGPCTGPGCCPRPALPTEPTLWMGVPVEPTPACARHDPPERYQATSGAIYRTITLKCGCPITVLEPDSYLCLGQDPAYRELAQALRQVWIQARLRAEPE